MTKPLRIFKQLYMINYYGLSGDAKIYTSLNKKQSIKACVMGSFLYPNYQSFDRF